MQGVGVLSVSLVKLPDAYASLAISDAYHLWREFQVAITCANNTGVEVVCTWILTVLACSKLS
jgi:hypothetical protein